MNRCALDFAQRCRGARTDLPLTARLDDQHLAEALLHLSGRLFGKGQRRNPGKRNSATDDQVDDTTDEGRRLSGACRSLHKKVGVPRITDAREGRCIGAGVDGRRTTHGSLRS
ncbi:hypothetical protein OUZ56_032673, partial [Daphnia magna]